MRNKKQFSNYIMMSFIPLVMVPVLIIAIFPYSSTTNKMITKTKDFYSDILMQITGNVDLYYNRYSSIFDEIGESKLFSDIINRPKQTAIEQVTYLHDGIEETGIKGLTNLISSKTRGSFCLIELNRPDALKKTSFSIIKSREENSLFEIEGIQNEPFFLKLKENNDDKPIVAFSYAVDIPVKDRRVMFFRPYRNKDEREIEAIMMILEMQDFLSQLYESQTNIKLGTLYLIDQFGNVLDKNHPSVDDYYDFDEKTGKYILNEGDDPDDKYEGMSFAEYQMLNTDERILNTEDVGKCIEKYEQRYMFVPECKIINYAGEKYLFIYMKAQDSQIQALYFHPLKQITASIYQLTFKIFLLILLVLVVVVVVTSFFCNRFFTEINNIVSKQNQLLAENCTFLRNENLNIKEFKDMNDSLNAMAGAISRTCMSFKDKMARQTNEIKAQDEEIALFNLAIEREKEKANDILRNIIPEKVLQDILQDNVSVEWFQNVGVMFCEISEVNCDLSKNDFSLVMKELSRIFAKFDSIMEQNNCIRIKTAGNVYLAASGIFEQDSHFALSLAKAAQECRKYIEESNVNSKIKFQIRIGINSGNVAGALIGNKRFSYDLFGDDVDIAQKLKSGAAFGQIVISWSTYKQVAGSFICNKQDSLNIDGYGKIESYLLEDEIL
jgi:class 3 adenylate cyclase